MKNKKSQAAIEYLMTNGWTILAVFITIAVLYTFVLSDYSLFLKPMCHTNIELYCSDFEVTRNDITVVLKNNIGSNVVISSISIGNCQNGTAITIPNDKAETITLTGCDNGGKFKKFESDIFINYYNIDALLNKTSVGYLTTRIE